MRQAPIRYKHENAQECKITGRVQMVMYRDFACRKARSLGLQGIVKNNIDGSVTVIAEGEEDVLMKYIAYLNRGPMLAHVERMETIWADANEEFSQFLITYK